MAYKKSNPNGQAAMAASEPVVIASNQSAVPVSFTGSTDVATQTTLSAINAKMVTGTDIGDVTINNSTGAAAVNIQDGGNTITVDGTVAVTNADLTTLAGAVSANHMQVDVLTAPTTTVNNSTAANLKVEATVAAAQTIAVTQGTATNLKAQAECYQGGVAVSAAAPLQVSLANNAANATAVKVNVASAGIASGAIASGAIASGAVASGAFASGAIASGALAAGSIAVGAITAGDTSIATTEDTARAAGEHLVKVGVSRLDTPVANANVSTDGDYTNFTCDNFGKLWTAGTAQEDVAHVAGEAIKANGVRRIDTAASSAGTSADWATMDASAEGALWATLTPTTTSGLSVANFTSGDTYTALTATAQAIKASAGNMYGYYIYNPNAAVSYVMIYNIAAASVTVGTSTALMVFAIPAGAAANVNFPYPITFSNAGWSIAAATTGGGNTAPTTALEVMVYYK